MLKEMDDDYSGGVDFDEFYTFLTGIYGEKEKREEIRRILRKGVDLANKEEKKKEETKTTEVSSKKPVGKEEKPKEAVASREKKKKELKAILEQVHTFIIEEKEDITPGGCIIETEAGIINASLENQWRALESAFEAFMKR